MGTWSDYAVKPGIILIYNTYMLSEERQADTRTLAVAGGRVDSGRMVPS